MFSYIGEGGRTDHIAALAEGIQVQELLVALEALNNDLLDVYHGCCLLGDGAAGGLDGKALHEK
jgi:hypothetical protein